MSAVEEARHLRAFIKRLLRAIKLTNKCELCIGSAAFCHQHEPFVEKLLVEGERLLSQTRPN